MKTQKQALSKWNIGLKTIVFSTLFFTFSCAETSMYDTDDEVQSEQSLTDTKQAAVAFDQVNQEIYKRIGKTITYPEQAKELGIQGKVFIEFNITSDGTIEDAKLLKGIGAGCDKEALRAFNAVTKDLKVEARMVDGKAVTQKLVLPVAFALD